MGRNTNSLGPIDRNKLDNREVSLLANYYAADSQTKGNAQRSAMAAGYGETYANQNALKIIRKYEDCSFRASARAVGITKPYLAMKLKQILELPLKDFTKEVIAAMRLSLANFGETTDQGGGGANINISGTSMVIVGATPKRMMALTGKMHRQLRPKPEVVIDAQAQVSNIDQRDGGQHSEASSGEGGHHHSEAPGDAGIPPAFEAAG